VARGLAGRIIQRLEDTGMKIVGMKMVWIDREFAKRHYRAHIKKFFYPTLESYVTSGPVIAICVEGVHSVENVRKLVGSTSPREAKPGTIRGDFAHYSTEYADKKNKAAANLIHASGSPEEAKEEVALWFTDRELHSYKTVHEVHTL
ncbi:nucleoside-diphosphate kinase, partial [Candidatus Woesearchaeota archaeon]|nr:nucleoside-diphosphate kinase [Candidatus Woesearchaeota archaeon]